MNIFFLLHSFGPQPRTYTTLWFWSFLHSIIFFFRNFFFRYFDQSRSVIILFNFWFYFYVIFLRSILIRYFKVDWTGSKENVCVCVCMCMFVCVVDIRVVIPCICAIQLVALKSSIPYFNCQASKQASNTEHFLHELFNSFLHRMHDATTLNEGQTEVHFYSIRPWCLKLSFFSSVHNRKFIRHAAQRLWHFPVNMCFKKKKSWIKLYFRMHIILNKRFVLRRY